MQNIQIAYKPSSLPDVLRGCLPMHICDAILRTGACPIEEIRLRRGRVVKVTSKEKNIACNTVISEREIQEIFSRMCGGSLYAFEDTIRQGYIPLEGGIRVGVCGSAACEGGKVIGVHNITGLMIRIPHAIAVNTDVLLEPFFASQNGKSPWRRFLPSALTVGYSYMLHLALAKPRFCVPLPKVPPRDMDGTLWWWTHAVN